ncbi:MAG: N-formylglutamate amidohydrolase [Alphaproteobacteria bacterium]|nr:N-formylglutamate amidohydrolase [Alphaproteobacteria bacterium]
MERDLPGVLYVKAPRGPRRRPVVFDSPHSGNEYPVDFGHALPHALIRRAEDAFVDELFQAAPDHGAALLAARFPRSYIDPNRSLTDMDARLLGEPWPTPLEPGSKSRRGIGLIRRTVAQTHAVYDRPLSVAEVSARIDGYYRPYHWAIQDLIDRLHGEFGRVYHVNCHSMQGGGPADFVLGDRDGTTCGADFTTHVRETLISMGYRVAVNDPLKGVELVRAYSAPDAGRHSLQIEVNRGLYLDEERVTKTDGFTPLQGDLERLIAAVAAFADTPT